MPDTLERESNERSPSRQFASLLLHPTKKLFYAGSFAIYGFITGCSGGADPGPILIARKVTLASQNNDSISYSQAAAPSYRNNSGVDAVLALTPGIAERAQPCKDVEITYTEESVSQDYRIVNRKAASACYLSPTKGALPSTNLPPIHVKRLNVDGKIDWYMVPSNRS